MTDLKWVGVYDLNRQYNPGEVVYFADDGFTYVCISPSLSIPPYILNSGFELLSGFEINSLDGGDF